MSWADSDGSGQKRSLLAILIHGEVSMSWEYDTVKVIHLGIFSLI